MWHNFDLKLSQIKMISNSFKLNETVMKCLTHNVTHFDLLCSAFLAEMAFHIILCMWSPQSCFSCIIHVPSPSNFDMYFSHFLTCLWTLGLPFAQLTAIHLLLLLLKLLLLRPPFLKKTSSPIASSSSSKHCPINHCHPSSPPAIVPDGDGGRESSLGTPRGESEDWES